MEEKHLYLIAKYLEFAMTKLCAACEDGHHEECGDGEPLELMPGTFLCDCATKGHTT